MQTPVKADKSLGQHFLIDEQVISQLVCAIAPKEGQHLVEIGAGLGALTVPVLQQAKRLTAIEFDRRVMSALKAATAIHGKLEIIEADVLRVDLSALAKEAPLRLIGNLPYNLSSPILFHCLAHRHQIKDMHFMLQKEVVARIVAQAGSKAYGRLSIMVQYYCEAESLFEIAPEAFNPPPKVDSAVVRLLVRTTPAWEVEEFAVFERLVREAFSQRRKMVRKSLRPYFSEAQLADLSIEPTARPETLGGEDFARMANALSARVAP
ncbi:16S rRNA (adenine(1518)-N(6)/adenine(1519)-N(6))-dimethyltransferase RsmA [Rappaport israeli]|uniref:16S rRNA (adenine(1518)-N(6)/adenine(1519)-N(6))- dimethyltransferase RsmA n=1 Tax=Rappaport israeli TaxID=1839807 RepID=UPI000930A392|nr:16S rRNA (adenine(1518)-N(6)/adenine(1519)-N(6))-dimethyltransferase RsmA [Rappaport israeli]